MPTITSTKQALRQRISDAIGDLITGTADSGTVSTLVDSILEVYPTDHFKGSEVSIVSGTGAGQSRIVTASTKATGTLTVTPNWTTAPNSTSVYEIHHMRGKGFYKTQYDSALDAAVDALADLEFTDTENVSLAFERGQGTSGTAGTLRSEYPMPSGFNYLWALEFLGKAPLAVHGTGHLETFRALGDATARTRLGQGFKIYQQALIGYIVVYMRKVGSPSDNLTIVVETNSAGLPSGTAVANGTSDTVDGSTLQERPRYQVFTFDPPILLQENTQYHLTLRRSGAVDATNYYEAGEDNGNVYGDGTLATYNGTVWTAVSGSDLIFAVSALATWIAFAAANWEYRPASTDQLYFKKLASEGVPIRLRGGAAIARPATESTNIPIRPEWAESFVLARLFSGRAGEQSPDNHSVRAQAEGGQLATVPYPARHLPANSVRIR